MIKKYNYFIKDNNSKNYEYLCSKVTQDTIKEQISSLEKRII